MHLWKQLLLYVPSLIQARSLRSSSSSSPAIDARQSALLLQPRLDYVHELDNSAGYIKFAVPNPSANSDPSEPASDNSYIFELQVFPSSEPCGQTNLRLNNRPLTSIWNGPYTYGQDHLSIDTRDNQHHDDLSFSWQASCLNSDSGPVQVLSVNITSPNADKVPSTNGGDLSRLAQYPAGFTISFNHRQPELILLSIVPDPSAHEPDGSLYWENPSLDDRLPLAILPIGDRIHDVSTLKDELEKLDLIPHHVPGFRKIFEGQKNVVDALIREKYEQVKDDIKQCKSIGCLLRTTLGSTEGALKIAYLRYLKCHKHTTDALELQCPGRLANLRPILNYGSSQRVALVKELPVYCKHELEVEESDASQASAGEMQAELDESFSPNEIGATSKIQLLSDEDFFFGNERPTKDEVRLALAILASVLGLAFITTVLHRYCCSPRARADRLARWEECRTRRQYSRLARRHACRQYVKGLWQRPWFGRSSRTTDYEEKRTLILAQENVLETAMQSEIERLGQPQRLVRNNASAAEQGFLYPSSEDESEPLSRSNSLPGYRSRASSGRPPSYKEFDAQSSSAVTDGFLNYTPSMTDFTPEGTDITPDSSVVEISPRHSSETLRTEYNAV